MLHFLIDWDTVRAHKDIKKAQNIAWDDQAWRLSVIFLNLWDRKYSEAIKNITRIKKFPLNIITGLNVEKFNNGIYKKNKDRTEILFWNAVIAKKMIADLGKFKFYKEKYCAWNNDQLLVDFLNKI